MEKKEKKKFKIPIGWHEQCDDSRYEHYAYIISNKK